MDSSSVKLAMSLQKWISEAQPEYKWLLKENDVLLFLSLWTIREFYEKFTTPGLFEDEGVEVRWKGDCIVLEMRQFLEYYGIDELMEEIFPKQ